jgi:zinc and cadmium transporter
MSGLPGLMTAAALAGGGALLMAALVLCLPVWLRRVIIPPAIAFAAGTMLGAVFLGLLPHALAHRSAEQVLPWTLGGIIGFFVLERCLLWRHCHTDHCAFHGRSAELILIGDGLHNLIDGIVLAVAWTASPTLGMSTTVAIIAHEIPQEIGDFAILLDAGWSPRKALFWNLVSAAPILIGALAGWWFLAAVQPAVPQLMAIAAAGFLYVAVADILPGLHQRGHGAWGWMQIPLLLAGIAVIVLCHLGAGHGTP